MDLSLWGKVAGEYLELSPLCWRASGKQKISKKNKQTRLYCHVLINSYLNFSEQSHNKGSVTHCVFPDSLHAVSWHGRRGEQTHSHDSIVVEGDVQSTVDIEAGGEDLGAVASHAARSPLPWRRCRTGATPEDVSVNAVLVVREVGL